MNVNRQINSVFDLTPKLVDMLHKAIYYVGKTLEVQKVIICGFYFNNSAAWLVTNNDGNIEAIKYESDLLFFDKSKAEEHLQRVKDDKEYQAKRKAEFEAEVNQ